MAGNITIEDIIRWALVEDIESGDITTQATVVGQQNITARIISKQKGVIAGTKIAEHVFKQVDNTLKIKLDYSDGDFVEPNETIVVIEGNTAAILRAERVALNFLGHLSGVASVYRRLCGPG